MRKLLITAFIFSWCAILFSFLVTSSAHLVQSRTMEFQITANEPTPNFVRSITVCAKERDSNAPVSVDGWSGGCKTQNGNSFSGVMPVPAQLKAWLLATIKISTNDPVQGEFEFTTPAFDFADAASPTKAVARIIREYSFVNLEITSVAKDSGVAGATETPAPGIVTVTAKNRAGTPVKLGTVAASSFAPSGIANFRFPIDKNFNDYLPLLEITAKRDYTQKNTLTVNATGGDEKTRFVFETNVMQAIYLQLRLYLTQFEGNCFNDAIKLGDKALFQDALGRRISSIITGPEGVRLVGLRPSGKAYHETLPSRINTRLDTANIVFPFDPREIPVDDTGFEQRKTMFHEFTHHTEFLAGVKGTTKPQSERNTDYQDNVVNILKNGWKRYESQVQAPGTNPAEWVPKWKIVEKRLKELEAGDAAGNILHDANLKDMNGFDTTLAVIKQHYLSNACGENLRDLIKLSDVLPDYNPNLVFVGPDEIKLGEEATIKAAVEDNDMNAVSLNPALNPTVVWKIPGGAQRVNYGDPWQYKPAQAKDYLIPAELTVTLDSKDYVIAKGEYALKVNPVATPTPTPTATPTPSATPTPTPTPDAREGKFSGVVPGNWEGGNTPQGFVMKRKEAKIKAPCGWNASVGADLRAKFVGMIGKPKDAVEAMALADEKFKARRQGNTPNDMAVGLFMACGKEGISGFAMGDFSGAIADFALWMRRGSGGAWSGYTGSYFGANGVGHVVKNGAVIEFSYSVGGGGCWENSDRSYLITQGVAAQEEARAILASLVWDGKGVINTKPYEGPKYDGSDLPKVVLVPAQLEKLKVGDTVKIEAVVENAKPEDSPFTYNWSGTFDGKPDDVKKSAVVRIKPTRPGKYRLDVGVDGARFGMGGVGLDYEVADYKVTVARAPESKLPVTVGVNVGFRATLTVDGKPSSGPFIYRWEPIPDIKFSVSETVETATQAVFSKPGRAKVWVAVLLKEGEVMTTVAEAQPVELDVVKPELKLEFTPASAVIGGQVKVKVTTNIPELKEIDYRWEVSSNGKQLGESQDSSEITFAPQNTQPVKVTARARVPFSGEDLGELSREYTARDYDVKVIVTGTQGPKPQIWKPGVGLVTEEKAIAVQQNVGLRVAVAPQPADVQFRYEWSVNEDSHIVSSGIGNEITANRSQVGTCLATVIVRDQNGVTLGQDSGQFEVTISDAMLKNSAKAKEAADKVTQAKTIVRRGQLDDAIRLAQEAATLDSGNQDATTLANQWHRERETCLAQIEKTRQLMARGKFSDADRELTVAKNLHNLYPPVLEMADQLANEWRKWDADIQQRIGEMRDANRRKEFKRALEIAAQIRQNVQVGPYEQTLREQEEWARKWETEKEQKRGILRGAEVKLRNYDYSGALKEFESGFTNYNNLWAASDPEPAYFGKLRDEAYTKNKRINELLIGIGSIVDNRNAALDVMQDHIVHCDEVLSLQPFNADAKRYRDILAARVRERNASATSAQFIAQGRELAAKNQHQEAAEAFTKAIQDNPNATEAYAGRGIAKRNLKDYNGSESDFNRALEIDPNHAGAYRGRSMLRRTQNRLPEAVADGTRAVELAPGNDSAYLTRGLAYDAQKNWDLALADFNRAIQLNPDYSMSYHYRGITRLSLKDNSGALADFVRYTALNPSDSSGFNNRGLAKERLGDFPGAIADYEKALALNPNNETARNNLAALRKRLDGNATPTPIVTGTKKESGTIDISGATWNWLDPRADASYNINGNNILIRAPKGNDLWPATNFDAPRLTKTVTGDFVLETRLSGQWREGYNGAGLAVSVGKNTVIRLERGIDGAPARPDHVAIFGFVEGRETGRGHILFSASDLYLKLERKGNTFIGYASADGSRWQKVGAVETRFPNTVEAGLLLVNEYNGNVFQAQFSEFKLLRLNELETPPPGNEADIFSTMNIYGVGNNPTAPATFTVNRPYVVTYILTYHWNNGRGTARPGSVSLRGPAGHVGTWNTNGLPGQGGVPNANWECRPNVVITEGTYTIVDSDPATWSQNSSSGGRGMSIIKGYPVSGAEVLPTPRPTPGPTPAGGSYVEAIFQNNSNDNVHIFVEGETFGPGNRLAPGERRNVRLPLPETGRIKFIAGRNGQVLTTKFWDGDPDDINRYPRVIFDGTRLLITTGLR